MQMERNRNSRRTYDVRLFTININKIYRIANYGIFERKSAMIFVRHLNLKYKFVNRHWN